MCVPYRIGDQRSICYDRTGEILIGRDNVKKSFSSKEDEVNLSQCLSWCTRWSMNRHGSGLNSHSPSLIISIEHTIKKNKTLLFVGFFYWYSPPREVYPPSPPPFFGVLWMGDRVKKNIWQKKGGNRTLNIFRKMEGIWDYIVVIYWIVMGCSLMMVGVVGLD